MARLPEFFEPQLATLVKAPPADPAYVYELKFDGYRMLCRIDGKGARFFSRNGKDWTEKLRPLADAMKGLGLGSGWLDGEVIVFGENGLPSFNRLQNMLDRKVVQDVRYAVFDIPFWGGEDLRDVPFIERSRFLKQLLPRQPKTSPIVQSKVVELDDPGRVDAVLQQACGMGLEGLMGKRKDAPYRSGRTSTWIKLPCRPKDEFIVIGWTTGEGARSALGALLLGQYDDAGKVRYAGKVGSGFSQQIINDLMRHLVPLAADKPSFEGKISTSDRWRGAKSAVFHWVKPELVIEVAFKERTKDGQLRQSSFLGIRRDKPAAAVHTEKVGRAAR
jgi:DNA ligase D-like protein (predicted ligase)